MIRVSAFIDGFNLYFGLRDTHDRKYLWLDLRRVVQRLLRPGQQLISVRYFTAAVRKDPGSQRNQRVYLDALRASGGVDIELGRVQEKKITCRNCRTTWRSYEEKETDVKIAVSPLAGAAANLFDTANLTLGRGILGRSLLPDVIDDGSGREYRRSQHWH